MDPCGSLEKVICCIQFIGLVVGSILQLLCTVPFLPKGFQEMPSVIRNMFQLGEIQRAIGIG